MSITPPGIPDPAGADRRRERLAQLEAAAQAEGWRVEREGQHLRVFPNAESAVGIPVWCSPAYRRPGEDDFLIGNRGKLCAPGAGVPEAVKVLRAQLEVVAIAEAAALGHQPGLGPLP